MLFMWVRSRAQQNPVMHKSWTGAGNRALLGSVHACREAMAPHTKLISCELRQALRQACTLLHSWLPTQPTPRLCAYDAEV